MLDATASCFIKSTSTNIDNVVNYLNEFPEASSSPPINCGASVGETSSNLSTVSNNSTSSSEMPHQQQQQQQQQQVSFAQMLKHSNTDVITVKETTMTLNASSSMKVAWPSLDATSAGPVPNTNQLSGWVTMAKQQQQQLSMLGRSKRYQNAPSPWLMKDTNSADLTSKEMNEDEENDSMPAPSFKHSFFSAIDESLRTIGSSM
jgi:hypothetical protein